MELELFMWNIEADFQGLKSPYFTSGCWYELIWTDMNKQIIIIIIIMSITVSRNSLHQRKF